MSEVGRQAVRDLGCLCASFLLPAHFSAVSSRRALLTLLMCTGTFSADQRNSEKKEGEILFIIYSRVSYYSAVAS